MPLIDPSRLPLDSASTDSRNHVASGTEGTKEAHPRMAEKYLLKPSEKQFMFDLVAANGEIILTSERYTTKESAKTGIASCQTNSSTDTNYDRRMSKDNRSYFVLKAANNQIIGTSQMYSSAQARDDGIASCKKNGPSARTEDKA
jgi:hypothetical protein